MQCFVQTSVPVTADGNDNVYYCDYDDALFRQRLPQGRVMMADGDDGVYDCAYDDALFRQRLLQAMVAITRTRMIPITFLQVDALRTDPSHTNMSHIGGA